MKRTPKNITASDYKKMRNLVDEFSSPNASKFSLKFGNIISAGLGTAISILALVAHFFNFITSRVKALTSRRIEVQETKALFEEKA